MTRGEELIPLRADERLEKELDRMYIREAHGFRFGVGDSRGDDDVFVRSGIYHAVAKLIDIDTAEV